MGKNGGPSTPKPTTPAPIASTLPTDQQATASLLGGVPGTTSNNAGINVDQAMLQALGTSANLQVPGAQDLLGIGTGSLSLAELLTAFDQLGTNPNGAGAIAALQQNLVLGGFYSKSYHPVMGVIQKADTDALKQAALHAAQSNGSLNDYVNQLAQYGQATGFGPAGLGQLTAAYAHGTAPVTDPAAIRMTMDTVFQKMLGRKATESEKTTMIANFQSEEHNAAAVKYQDQYRQQKAYLDAIGKQSTPQNIGTDNQNDDFLNPAPTQDTPNFGPGGGGDFGTNPTPHNVTNYGPGGGGDFGPPGSPQPPNLSPKPGEAGFRAEYAPGAPSTLQSLDPKFAQRFATQAAQIGGLTAQGNGMSYNIGGPNGAAVQGVQAWAQRNTGPGKLFASVTQGTTGPNGPTVHVEFNATVGDDARGAITALGVRAPTTNSGNYSDQRQSFLQSLKNSQQGGNYQWAPNQQTGGYGAYGFTQSSWAVAAQAANIPQQDWGNPTAGEQDAAASALIDRYYQQFGDWRTVAAAMFAGPGVAQASRNNASSLSQIRIGSQTAADYVNNIMSRFQGPGGGQGNAADLSAQVTDVMTPDLTAESQLNAQTQHPAEYQATQMSNQYDTFVNLLKGPEFTGRLPTG